MKRLLLLLFIIAICSCQKNQTPASDQSPGIAANIKRTDTIFLDYSFGMSSIDFQQHTKKLIKEGKLDKKGRYDFHLENYPSITYLIPEYYKGKLYKLSLLSDYTGDSVVDMTKSLFLQLAIVYTKKYHFEKVMDGMMYEYKEGNLKIEIVDNIYTPTINYIDMDVEKIVEQEKDILDNKTTEKTINDI